MAATFLGGLSPDLADKIRSAGTVRTYPARSFVFHEGDTSTGVLVVNSGLLRVDRTTPSGRVALLDLAIEGTLIGELGVIDGAPRSATVSTVTECQITYVSAERFRVLLRDDVMIKDAVLERLTRRIRQLSSQFLETATMDAPARVASRLLSLVEIEQHLGRCKVAADGSVDLKLPISQEELGQWAGLAREGAVKGLRTLRSIGAIETGRKRVHINSLEQLAKRANSN